MLLVPTVVAAAVQLQTANAPSPATGHAQVIAHGVAPMPADSVAWRAVADTAELPASAVAEQRALGFAVADRSALVVNDSGTGAQWRLAPGEAVFVPAGAEQQRASLGTADAPYYRLALVPAGQASDAGGDRLVLAGGPFDAPAGRAFDLALVRDVLEPGGRTSVPSPGLPALVLATDGQIEITASGQLPMRLAAGHAASLTGNLSIAAVGSQPAVVVAAVIGPEVPAPPAAATGAITLTARACPASVDPQAFAGNAVTPQGTATCVPVSLNPAPTLALADGSSLPPTDANASAGTSHWTGLGFGTFPLASLSLPNGSDRYVVTDASGSVIGTGGSDAQAAPVGLAVSADHPDLSATVYFLQPAATAKVTLSAFACPNTVTVDTLRNQEEDCVAIDTGFTPQLSDANGQPVAATTGGDGTRWTGLASGTYGFAFTTLPAGYDTYVVPEATFDSSSGTYTLTIDLSSPTVALRAYFLQPPAPATPVPSTPTAVPEANGNMTVALFDCPPGMTAQTFNPNGCGPSKGLGVELVDANGTRHGADEATTGNGALTWGGVPIGPVTVSVVAIPPDATSVIAPGADPVSSNPPAFSVALSNAQRNGGIAVYSLRPGGPASPAP